MQRDSLASISQQYSFAALLSAMSARGLAAVDLLRSVCQNNLLGQGGNAAVYAIPGIPDFVVRVPTWEGGERALPSCTLVQVEDPLPDLNVGQAVAQLGNCQILKRQNGIPAGVPYGPVRRAWGEEAVGLYFDSLARAARMPQAAYDRFAATLLIVNEHGFQFDPSKANNVLIDEPSASFNLVDLSRRSEGSSYRDSLVSMSVTLMDTPCAWKVPDRSQIEPSYREILSKCLRACSHTGLPINLCSSAEYCFNLAGMQEQLAGLKSRCSS
jgi:hypothetical protein